MLFSKQPFRMNADARSGGAIAFAVVDGAITEAFASLRSAGPSQACTREIAMSRVLKFVTTLVLSLLVTGGTVMAQSPSPSEIAGRNKSLVQAGFDAWKAGTGSPFELLAEGASWTIVGNSDASRAYPSREAFLSEVIRPFNARMQDGIKPSIHGLYADGDAVVIHFDAAGVAKDGRPYANTYAWFFEMRDGKVVKATAFFDSLAFNDLWRRIQP